jgi:hypothetical protein
VLTVVQHQKQPARTQVTRKREHQWLLPRFANAHRSGDCRADERWLPNRREIYEGYFVGEWVGPARVLYARREFDRQAGLAAAAWANERE